LKVEQYDSRGIYAQFRSHLIERRERDNLRLLDDLLGNASSLPHAIRRPARRVAEKSNVLDEMRLHYGGLTPSQKRGERYFTNFLAPRWYPRVRSEVAPKRRGGI
jgi:hypothetical protein